MKSPCMNLRGQKYGRLIVIDEAPKSGRRRYWFCICACASARICVVKQDHLRGGRIKSCGCLQAENARRLFTTHGHTRESISSEYKIWANMKARCLNNKNHAFKNYGGRGIKICRKWKDSFEAFFNDMGPRPSINHSIDRRDNNGDYEPNNCRWATRAEQCANRRNNVFIEFNGEILPVGEVANQVGLSVDVIRERIRGGWHPTRVLSQGIGYPRPRAPKGAARQ